MPPVFITVRDRVRDLRLLVDWLERAGQERIVLLDNDSSYEPLLDYLDHTPHEVVRLGRNLGSRALWNAGLAPDEWFVLTDPDILPLDECPFDVVDHLRALLEASPGHPKAGLGLYLDDLPVDWWNMAHERMLVEPAREISPGVFDSLIDTTFALYRRGADFSFHAIRTGWPYQARHSSWYCTEPDDEDAYYLDRAETGPTGSSWKENL